MKVKGHSKIILADANTGAVETYDNDNMVTNALQKFLSPIPAVNMSMDLCQSNSPLWQRILGGVMLFNGNIEEKADHILRTEGLTMVGNAGVEYSNAEDVPELGSFNANESGVQSDGSLKIVFDWATSQANGTIKSICLSSSKGAIVGKGNTSLKNLSIANAKYLSDYSWSNNNTYRFQLPSGFTYSSVAYADAINNCMYLLSGVSKTGCTLKKYYICLSNYDVRKNGYMIDNFVEDIAITFPAEVATLITSSSYTWSMVTNGNNVYILMSNDSNIYASDKFYVIKIDGSFNVTATQVTNTTGVTLYNYSYNSEKYYNRRFNFAVTENGYLFIPTQYFEGLYTIKLSDSTIINCVETLTDAKYYRIYAIGNVVYDITESTRMTVYDMVSNTTSYTNGNMHYCSSSYPTSCIQVYGDDTLYFSTESWDSYIRVYKRADYLATINNLSEPVTKTAAKTMKLIYTLTFE